MTKFTINLFGVLFTLAASLAVQAAPGSPGPLSVIDSTVDRPTLIHLPSNYTPKRAWPVVLLLHGYSSDARLMDDYFGFNAEVSQRGFILIVASGMKNSARLRYWNATDGCCDFEHRGNDDVTYLKTLIEEAQTKYSIDTKRIYVAGHSNGGFMAHRLACELSGTVAAIASFAGETWTDAARCVPRFPVSVLQIQALDDDTIHYAGDPQGYPNLAPYPGSVETAARWRAYNHCGPMTHDGRLNLTVAIPGADTTAMSWEHCSGDSQVDLWTIDAHHGFLHFPHTPLLRHEFTERVLDFLLQKRHE